jgi:hypothetical protein
MIQSLGSGLGHAASTAKRGMSSAQAALAATAAKTSAKYNLMALLLKADMIFVRLAIPLYFFVEHDLFPKSGAHFFGIML